MCGIAGILQFNNNHVRPDIFRVTSAMKHRGPDADGFYHDEKVSLGHRRLAIIDLSAEANQPFADNSGRYILVYNGEIYNYRDLRLELTGYNFRTNSDTEVVMAAFIKWGVSCVSRLKGMFAIAIWDKIEGCLYIFRDRLGVKPLYYWCDDNVFLFASEIRAILASGMVERRLNLDALEGYFMFQSFGYPNTPINRVFQVEAGSYLVVKNGTFYRQTYWEVGKTKLDFDYDNESRVKVEIERLLGQSISQRLVSDVPVGAFLSGGIDSSAVVGLMAKYSLDKPRTFTVSFDEKEYDERAYANVVSAKFSTQHTSICVTQDSFLDDLETALDSYDSPSGDGVNTYVVSKAIRNSGITVALSGIGGDELFAGYPFFKSYLFMRKFKFFFGLIKPLRKLLPSFGFTGSRDDRFNSILKANSLDIEYIYPELRRIISKRILGKLTKFSSSSFELEEVLKARRDIINRLPLLSQVTAAELLGYTQQTLLKDTDQMSMSVSLEVREPFFDHELVEFLLQVPDNIKKPKYPKSLLVESLSPLLPDEIVFRKKQGFVFPWSSWMRRELRDFCETKIKMIAQRDFIDGSNLIKYWNQFKAGDDSISWTAIWLFVVLEHWMDKNNVD